MNRYEEDFEVLKLHTPQAIFVQGMHICTCTRKKNICKKIMCLIKSADLSSDVVYKKACCRTWNL